MDRPRHAQGRRTRGPTVPRCVLAAIVTLGATSCDRRETGVRATAAPEEPRDEPTPPSDGPASAGAVLPPRAAPTTVFVVGAGLIPLLCFDGQRASSPSEGPDEVGCAAPIASGDEVAVVGGAVSTIGGRIELPCGSETTIPARALQPEPDPSAALAVWPSDAAPSIELAPDPFIATKDELAAMTKIVADEVAGRYALPPRLEWTSGTLADIDGDGTLDRVVAAHEASMLYGIIVFFPGDGGASAGAGADPRVLSLLQFDRPRVIARSNLDGQPGEEIIVDSAFVEGIEDQTVTSAYSTRVIAWDGSQEVEVASWGCRMF